MIITKKHQLFNFVMSAIILTLLVVGGLKVTASSNKIITKPVNQTVLPSSTIQNPVKPASVNVCQGNTLANEIIVSISSQHLWACNLTNQLYNSPVVTGDENYASDRTIPRRPKFV